MLPNLLFKHQLCFEICANLMIGSHSTQCNFMDSLFQFINTFFHIKDKIPEFNSE